jgi:hypothetical protein
LTIRICNNLWQDNYNTFLARVSFVNALIHMIKRLIVALYIYIYIYACRKIYLTKLIWYNSKRQYDTIVAVIFPCVVQFILLYFNVFKVFFFFPIHLIIFFPDITSYKCYISQSQSKLYYFINFFNCNIIPIFLIYYANFKIKIH